MILSVLGMVFTTVRIKSFIKSTKKPKFVTELICWVEHLHKDNQLKRIRKMKTIQDKINECNQKLEEIEGRIEEIKHATPIKLSASKLIEEYYDVSYSEAVMQTAKAEALKKQNEKLLYWFQVREFLLEENEEFRGSLK